MSEKIVLIDGHSILNRAFFGIPDLTNSEGLHTNAVYGFLNIMFKILEEEKPEYLTVAFDVSAPTFRHDMFAEYKGTRKPMADELRQQVPVMKEVLKSMGIKVMEQAGLEADDLLGTIAKKSEAAGLEVRVISGDRDLLQLASDHICIRIPKTKKTGTTVEDYFAKDVLEAYQVTPTEFIDVKALMGDSSDNIPGLPGVGEKTATNLIVTYKSIENAFAHVEELKPPRAKNAFLEHYDLAQMSKTLATIKVDCELDYNLSDAKITDFYTPEAYEWMKRLELKNLLKRFDTPAMGSNEIEEKFLKVTSFEETEEIFKTAKEQAEVGFEFLLEKDVLSGISICWEEKVYFLPVQGFVTEAYLFSKVTELIGSTRTYTMKLKQKLKFLGDVRKAQIYDMEIGAYLLNPLKSEYGYDDLGRDYLGMTVPSRTELLGKASYEDALEKQEGAALKLAGYMAYVTCHSAAEILKELDEKGMKKLYEEVEMPLIFTLFDMEQEGIAVEKEDLRVYGEQLTGRIAQLEQEIYKAAGEEFNINSPKQLGVILFEKMQMPYGKKTKTGYSTAASVLEKLAPEFPTVSQILEYRQLTKLKSTYADGLAGCIAEDGRIHSTFQQTITATGRLSSTEPNLQNIPIRVELGRLIRKVFVPREGFVFVDADYSQIELRVLAHLSGDDNLIQAYKDSKDIHRSTAAEVFHVPFEEVTDLQRRNAKAVNFGIVYGESAFGLSQNLSITRKEADEYIKRYFESYPGIKGYLEGKVTEAKETGAVKTMFGRIRPVPEISSKNFMQRSFGERIAMNSPIQGTAADIIKIAMNRVNERLREGKFKSKLILQIHDELLIEAAKDELEQVQELLAEEMHNAAQLSVRLEIDMHTGNNWYEVK